MITRKKRLHMILTVLVVMLAMGASSMLLTIRPAASEDPAYDTSILQELKEETPDTIPLLTFSAKETGRVFLDSLVVSGEAQVAASQNAISETILSSAQTMLEEIEKEKEAEKEAKEKEEQENLEEEEILEASYAEPSYEEYDYEDYSYEDYSYEETYTEPSYEEPAQEENTVSEEASYPEETTQTEETTASEDTSLETASLESTGETASSEDTSSYGGYTDLDYLAAICQIEAGYNYDGCLAVANVVLNRVKAGFASSIYDVIYAPYQFATYTMDYWLTNGTSEAARQAAQDALNGVNNVGDYLFFNGQTWLDPATLTVPYVIIGGNVFY